MLEHFPDRATLLELEPEELAPLLLRYLTGPHASGMLNRFNFMQNIPDGLLAQRFMEAWMWLEREGLLAPWPPDIGFVRFVTRRGHAVVSEEHFDTFLQTKFFPPHIDDVMAKAVKPLFMRGDYETAVFRAFKEVEVRVRKKATLGNEIFGRNLMVQAFGEAGALTDRAAPKGEKDALRELFAGAISSFKNPASHREVQFDDVHEVVDLICFANQLLRIVDRTPVSSNNISAK
jgi:uncharacterized protein (TIGR02391 family)